MNQGQLIFKTGSVQSFDLAVPNYLGNATSLCIPDDKCCSYA